LASFFKEHPELENASLGVTVQAAVRLYTEYTALRNELSDHEVQERDQASERKASRQALRKRIRNVIQELGFALADDDERWRAFNLTPPAVSKQKRKETRAAKAKAAQEAETKLEVVNVAPVAAAA
jgi:hypothetical protein